MSRKQKCKVQKTQGAQGNTGIEGTLGQHDERGPGETNQGGADTQNRWATENETHRETGYKIIQEVNDTQNHNTGNDTKTEATTATAIILKILRIMDTYQLIQT